MSLSHDDLVISDSLHENSFVILKKDITLRLKNLYTEILTEKKLGDKIKISILPTPYKKVAIDSSERLNQIAAKLICVETQDQLECINHELSLVESDIHLKLEHAFQETQQMIEKLKNTVNIDDIKLKIKANIRKKIQEKIQENKTKIFENVSRSDFKEQLSNLVLKKQQELNHKTQVDEFEKELIHISECLISGNLEQISTIPFFIHNKHYLKKYYPENHNISQQSLKIFVKAQIRKMLISYTDRNEKEVYYLNLISYIERLASEQVSMIFARDRTSQLKRYVAQIKKEKHDQKLIVCQEEIHKIKKINLASSRIKHYLRNFVMENNKFIPDFLTRLLGD